MKKVVLTLSGFILMALAISSCSKNTLDQPNFPGLRCGVNSTEYIADTSYYKQKPTVIGTTIYALTGTQTRFEFDLVAADTVGTYTLDSVRNTAYYFDGNTRYRSSSGTVIISYNNDSVAQMSGTFNFEGRASNGSTTSINYGYFNNIPRHY